MTEQPKQEFRGTFEGANSSARWSPDAAALAAISFTFDNGHLSTYTHAFPLLRKAGLVGHIAAITDLVGKPGRYSWEQIHEMAAAGWEVESHTRSHNLSDVRPENLQREAVESKRMLEAHGLTVNIFNFPGGPWQDDPIFLPGGPFDKMVRRHYAGYLPIHNRMPHPMRPPIDSYRLSWQTGECGMADQYAAPFDAIRAGIDQAIAEGGWYNSLWHDVTTNNEKHWPKFQQVVDYAAAQVRVGRMRCVTTSDYLGLPRQGSGKM